MKSPKYKTPVKIKKDSNYEWENNKVVISYISIMIALIAWIVVYMTKKEGWWDAIDEKAPGWGNSQLLIVLFIFTWVACFTYSNYKLSFILTGDAINLMHFTFIINIVLVGAFFYSISDGVENFTESSYIITICIFTSLFAFYQSYLTKNNILKLVTGLGVIVVIYLDAWSWVLSKNM